MKLFNSPITTFQFKGTNFFIKRDDLLDPNFNGNKARKLYCYFNNQFPNINTLISYGGNQSNLMYSLSCLAKIKNWSFIYYVKNISKQAKININSNLHLSINNGMKIICLENNFNEFTSNYASLSNELLIKQGAQQIEAEIGIKILANEINIWAQQNNYEKLNIFLPSGTGTTAFFLQKHLPNYNILTTNCIGTVGYLNKQFSLLNIDNNIKLPTILENKQNRFAIPNLELLNIINEINLASQIEFDLVYDPVGWKILLNNLPDINGEILYIHCGGISGNDSMKQRYNYLTTNKTW